MTTPKRILTADIGGTNCRFGLFSLSHEELVLERASWKRTGDMRTVRDVITAWDDEFPDTPSGGMDCAVIALAGPVNGMRRAKTTNADLVIDLDELDACCSIPRSNLINDFEAQAYACMTPAGTESTLVFPGTQAGTARQTVGIVGAGTGFGAATLHVEGTSWKAFPSEAGHTVFPFSGPEEAVFQQYLLRSLSTPFIRCDDVLTGKGLSLLHAFLTGETLDPADVAREAFCRNSQTRQWFARFYGRMCRNWVLMNMCSGGMFIAGGIAAQSPDIVQCEEFSEEFYLARDFEALFRSVPLRLMTDRHSGLWGAAWLGADMLCGNEN